MGCVSSTDPSQAQLLREMIRRDRAAGALSRPASQRAPQNNASPFAPLALPPPPPPPPQLLSTSTARERPTIPSAPLSDRAGPTQPRAGSPTDANAASRRRRHKSHESGPYLATSNVASAPGWTTSASRPSPHPDRPYGGGADYPVPTLLVLPDVPVLESHASGDAPSSAGPSMAGVPK